MDVDEVGNDLEEYQEEDPDAIAGAAGAQGPPGTKSHKTKSSRA
jgi:hypothetical protein